MKDEDIAFYKTLYNMQNQTNHFLCDNNGEVMRQIDEISKNECFINAIDKVAMCYTDFFGDKDRNSAIVIGDCR